MRGGVHWYAAQAIPQIDPPEAEKRAISGWKLSMAIKVSLTASRNHALMLRADNFFLKLLLTQILCWILSDNTKEGGEASSGRPGELRDSAG